MSCCAIILSYKRSTNIPRILDTLLALDEIDAVIVSNNNPETELSGLLASYLSHPRFTLIQQAERCHCIKRFQIAAELEHDEFICIDDDVFLTENQVHYLLLQLRLNPTVPHGFNGQLECFNQDGLFLHGGVGYATHPIDVLNNGYFFTAAHVRKLFQNAALLGLNNIADAVFIDDILLSFSGDGKPICHDIGPIEFCPSSVQEGIATYKEHAFDAIRMPPYLTLRQYAPRNHQEL